jgi:hypothetical protein
VNPASSAHLEEVRKIIYEVLGGDVSKVFLSRVDATLADWASGDMTAAQACDKIKKIVALFIDEKKAIEISSRCAPIVMRESAGTR